MKKPLLVFILVVFALSLSGCCFFMDPPPAPEPLKAAAVAPAPAPAPMASPAPAAVVVAPLLLLPADSDNDGVSDSNDKCPGTSSGVPVDAKGCPLDSDRDGVIDSADQCPGTKMGLAVDSNGCPPPIEENVKIAIDVLFASGKADINENSTGDIKDLGVFMETYPTTTTVIEGHTDNVGTDALNNKLSQRRAEAVRDYLIKNYSIEPGRIQAVGYGSSRPIADNGTADGRKMNRRIEAAVETTVLIPQE
jgi:OOP family OmpA-OmpF porin